MFSEKEQWSRGESDKLAQELNRSVADYKKDLAVAEATLKANEEAKKMNALEVETLKNELATMRKQVELSSFFNLFFGIFPKSFVGFELVTLHTN